MIKEKKPMEVELPQSLESVEIAIGWKAQIPNKGLSGS